MLTTFENYLKEQFVVDPFDFWNINMLCEFAIAYVTVFIIMIVAEIILNILMC